MIGLPPRIEDRLAMVPECGCWIWLGELNRNGYGRISLGGKRLMAHRVLYELMVGPIGEGLVLDHLCRMRCCVNPAHMEPVTVRENTLRGLAKLFTKKEELQCAKAPSSELSLA